MTDPGDAGRCGVFCLKFWDWERIQLIYSREKMGRNWVELENKNTDHAQLSVFVYLPGPTV